MCVQNRKCHVGVSLESVGVPSHGCLRDLEWLTRVVSIVPCSQSIVRSDVYIDLPTVKLTCLKTVSHGKFGYIDLALYESNGQIKEVYVKRPILAGRSLLHEACVQICVGEYLQQIGFPTGAPSVVRIFRLADQSICFAMDPIEQANTLDRHLESVPPSRVQSILIECLFQLCSIMWHLSAVVGINHRDVKPSNFLITEHEPRTKIITIGSELLEITSRFTLTLIDFGFSCVGSIETHQATLSLSGVYSRMDPCPKDGRDMYLFLGLCYIDFHEVFSPGLKILFEGWLEVNGSNLCNMIRKNRDKTHTKNWLYFIAGNEGIHQFHSCPIRIIHDLIGFSSAAS